MNRGKVGEERGGKETDGCLLTMSSTSQCKLSIAHTVKHYIMALMIQKVMSLILLRRLTKIKLVSFTAFVLR
jgi:hypothetical protein